MGRFGACTLCATLVVAGGLILGLHGQTADEPRLQILANVGLPANPAAAPALSLPALKQVLTYNHAAPYVQTYFDIAFPTSVGQALDAAIATYFAGQGTPQSIITTVSQAKTQ